MHTRHASALVAATLVVAGAGGYVLTRDPAVSQATTTPPVIPSASTTRAPLLPDLPSPQRTATAAGVRALLNRAVTDPGLGPGLAGVVVDTATGTTLYDRDASTPLPPASTAKLFTAVASLLALGPAATLSTSTARAGSTVYLVGGGDVTLSDARRATGYPAPASLRQLANRTVRGLGSLRRVRVRVDTSLWSGPSAASGWSPSYVTEGDVAPPTSLEVDEGRLNPGAVAGRRLNDPAARAGREFADLLRARHCRVLGPVQAAPAPSGAAAVAAVHSPPVSVLVQQMLTNSDNDLAEALGRAVALHDHRPPTFDGAARAVTARVHAVGVPSAAMQLRDTSGLSQLDRVTPRALTDLLTAVSGPDGAPLRPLLGGLPVAGFSGTLADRYRTAPADRAAGLLRAKTGTLRGVNSLAGYVVDSDEQLLAFAFIAAHAPAPSTTEAALDRLAARLVSCGCDS